MSERYGSYRGGRKRTTKRKGREKEGGDEKEEQDPTKIKYTPKYYWDN